MELFPHVLILVVSLGALFYSGGMLVRSLTWIGRYLNISEYILSFVLAAFATSLPELFVGISSAFQKVPQLSLGNLVGANVLDMTIVLGISILVAGSIATRGSLDRKDALLTLGSILAPGILMLDRTLSRLDGILLIGMFVLYTIHLIRETHVTPSVNSMHSEERSLRSFLRHFTILILGILLLLASSRLAVGESIAIAENFKFPLFLVGILIAFGTSLPETVFGIKSVTLRHSSMSIGNSLGSVVLNTSLILGIVAVIHPISILARTPTLIGIGLVLALVFITEFLGLRCGKLTRPFGIVLIACAIAFIAVQNLL